MKSIEEIEERIQRRFKKAIVFIGRCKDCPSPCEYYNPEGDIPDECKWEDI